MVMINKRRAPLYLPRGDTRKWLATEILEGKHALAWVKKRVMAKNIALLAINRLSEPPLIAYLPVVKLSQRTQDISVEILYKVRKIKIIVNLNQYVIVLIP